MDLERRKDESSSALVEKIIEGEERTSSSWSSVAISRSTPCTSRPKVLKYLEFAEGGRGRGLVVMVDMIEGGWGGFVQWVVVRGKEGAGAALSSLSRIPPSSFLLEGYVTPPSESWLMRRTCGFWLLPKYPASSNLENRGKSACSTSFLPPSLFQLRSQPGRLRTPFPRAEIREQSSHICI